MKITSEVKIGLIGIVTVFLIIWGVKYLLGTNLLKNTHRYYATYDAVDGLEPAAPVLLKGYKIGTVSDVLFQPEINPSFILSIDIEKKYRIPLGSTAEIFSADLLGSKALRINSSGKKEYHSSQDTLLSDLVHDMLSSVMENISPVLENIQQLASTLDSVGVSINDLLNDPSTKGTIRNLDEASGALNEKLSDNGSISRTLDNLAAVSSNLKDQNEQIAATINNLHSVSKDIEESDLDSILINLEAVTLSLKNVSQQMESGEGTVGKLIHDDALYDHISSLSADLDSLIIDITAHPEKYVRFSIFGK